jgi:hypothetical protein
MPAADTIIQIVSGNILDTKCDVLVLKYAQAWHGADLAVAKKLDLGGFWDAPAPGDFRTMKPDPAANIQAPMILFEGMPAIGRIDYSAIRTFGKSAMQHLSIAAPDAKHIAMTVHGVNLGMDEREAFLAQLGGMLDALEDTLLLRELERISIVEFRNERCLRLSQLLKDRGLDRPLVRSPKTIGAITKMSASNAPVASAGQPKEKPHVFVAMPFTDDMEDVYIFGIQGPVQGAGLLCERVDMDVFTGDILDRIKTRIETADLVIAVLNGANANVYLEVGYAWGKNRKTLLVCKNPDELKFDVKGQRCVVYSSINDLSKKMAKELQVLI